MASISSAGVGSGLDIENIISKLMQVESQPLTALATKEASYQAKISAYGAMKGALSSLQSAATTLTKADTFTGRSASVSDSSVLSASASSTAANGTYSLSITQLAKFHAVRSDTNFASTDATFNTGTLSISIGGGTATNITIDSTNNTLASIRDAINDSNAGVTASIINDGGTNRLVLASKTSGSVGAITVSASDSGSGGTHALTTLTSASLVTTQAADDANFTVNGIAITRSSNTVSDVIEGVTLSLGKGTLASPGTATVTVTHNTGAISSAVNAFVKAFNDVVKEIKSDTAYDAATKRSSVLTGDSTARSISSRLTSLVYASVSGVTGGISRLSDIGVTMQKDGTLSVDSGKLSSALADPDMDVKSLFSQTTSGNTGIAVRFASTLSALINTNGVLDSRTDGIQASIKLIEKQREMLNLRLTAIEKRYRTQFSALDSMIASMNRTSQYLSQQLANLPNTSA